jgi:hypothetical protein
MILWLDPERRTDYGDGLLESSLSHGQPMIERLNIKPYCRTGQPTDYRHRKLKKAEMKTEAKVLTGSYAAVA